MDIERVERKRLSSLIMHDDVLAHRTRLDEMHWYVAFLARRIDGRLAATQLVGYASFRTVVWC